MDDEAILHSALNGCNIIHVKEATPVSLKRALLPEEKSGKRRKKDAQKDFEQFQIESRERFKIIQQNLAKASYHLSQIKFPESWKKCKDNN